jgi:hypothetical protein
MTSGLLAQGRFGKQDFVYVAADDVYLCPAGEQLRFWFHEGEDRNAALGPSHSVGGSLRRQSGVLSIRRIRTPFEARRCSSRFGELSASQNRLKNRFNRRLSNSEAG